MAATLNINGLEYSHASLDIVWGTLGIVGVKDVKYKHGLKCGDVKGTLAQRIGVTEGEYTASASMTILRSYWEKVRQAQAAADAAGTRLDIFVNRSAKGMVTITDRLAKCRATETEHSSSSGVDPNEVNVTIDTWGIYENGEKPYPGFVDV